MQHEKIFQLEIIRSPFLLNICISLKRVPPIVFVEKTKAEGCEHKATSVSLSTSHHPHWKIGDMLVSGGARILTRGYRSLCAAWQHDQIKRKSALRKINTSSLVPFKRGLHKKVTTNKQTNKLETQLFGTIPRLAEREGVDEVKQTFAIVISMIPEHEPSQENLAKEAECWQWGLLAKVPLDCTLAFSDHHLGHDVNMWHGGPGLVHHLNFSVSPKGLSLTSCPPTEIPKPRPTPSSGGRGS